MPRNTKKTQPATASSRISDGGVTPPNLPADPESFWKSPANRPAPPPPPSPDTTPVLKKLGPLPFPKGSFPVMGFLATLYEHVSSHAAQWLTKDSNE